MKRREMKHTLVVIVAVLASFSACSAQSNKYVGKKYVGRWIIVEFRSGNKAYMTATISGDVGQVHYDVDGNRVTIQGNGESIVFTEGPDGVLRSTGMRGDALRCVNCAPGPGFSGKYRMDWSAKTFILEFRPDYSASLTTVEKSGSSSIKGTYSVQGDLIRFKTAQGESILTKNEDGSLTSSAVSLGYVPYPMNALFKKVN
jgi:hypothetical protein